MSRRLASTLLSYRRSTSLILGGAFTYHHLRLSKPLLNESKDGKPWPDTRSLSNQQSATKNGRQQVQTSGQNFENDANETVDEDDVALFEADQDSAAWASLSSRVADVRRALNAIKWSQLGENIADFFVPDWAVDLPAYFAKLQRELDMAPGSLAEEIWLEAQDPDFNPEILRPARVRIGSDICAEEVEFQQKRKRFTRTALARYLDIPERKIHPEDVPTIAICGSGGGLRALVAGTSSYHSAQEAGLFDCATYTAGVSGSCWLQAIYHSSLGKQDFSTVLSHLKRRIGTHIAYPPAALTLLTTAPTNKFLLSGIVEKVRGDNNAQLGLVDVYGVLLAARLLVPRAELGVDHRDLKISNQQEYLKNGSHPLPIYSAVRHEIPVEETSSKEEKDTGKVSPETREKAKQEAWFQWFEFTPYELWSEEIQAGIPTWSVGRQFQNGRSRVRDSGLHVPELRIPFMLGIWGSAFCATLSHFYKEIRPLVKGLAGFGGIDDLLEEKNDELVKVHPIEPAAIPNYVLGLEKQLPSTAPKNIFNSEHLELADAGMSNNLPIYPLLRQGRNVDVLIAFDASADIKTENWLSVADGYARQRGIKGWPLGAGWPKDTATQDATSKDLDLAEAASPQQAAGKIADAREAKREAERSAAATDGLRMESAGDKSQDNNHDTAKRTDLSYCNVWVGTTIERSTPAEPPQSKRLDPDSNWEPMSPDAGIAVVYFPFLPNPKVAGVDPATSDFMSTWNFVYTPENIEKVVDLARANFREGEEQVKRTVRAVYERKKKKRVEGERMIELKRLGRVLEGARENW